MSSTAPLAEPTSSILLQQAPAMPPTTESVRYASSSDTRTTSTVPTACRMPPSAPVRYGSTADSASAPVPGPNSSPASSTEPPIPSSTRSSSAATYSITARIFPPSSASGDTLTISSSTSFDSFSSTTARSRKAVDIIQSIITTMA